MSYPLLPLLLVLVLVLLTAAPSSLAAGGSGAQSVGDRIARIVNPAVRKADKRRERLDRAVRARPREGAAEAIRQPEEEGSIGASRRRPPSRWTPAAR